MTEIYRCDDKDVLVAYLYGELDAATRAHVDLHLGHCEPCTREVAGLQGLRSELGSWLPPEPELGFTITRKPAEAFVPPAPAPVLRPAAWQWRGLPAWAQAAAAVLVLAAGAALANLHIRYDAAGVTVSTGWMTPAAATRASDAPAVTIPVSTAAPADWRPAFEALAAQVDQLETQPGGQASAVNQPRVTGGDAGQGAVLREVTDLIEASEDRQRQELALRLTQLGRDLEVQRRADLVRIEQSFGQVEGRAGAEMARQRELLMNYVRQASIRVPQQ